jgi:P27 family predicted phage terminase small subunit
MGERGPISQLKLPPKLRIISDARPDTGTVNSIIPPNAPLPPDDLPDAGRAMWNELVGELAEAGLVARLDRFALHLAIRHYLAAIDSSDELFREGPTVSGSMGTPVRNPASAAFKIHSDTFLTFAKQFGLTFASRVRMTLPEEHQDALDTGNPFASRASSDE